jgi:hypothetical protein
MSKRSPTTKDVGLLEQLYRDGQIALAPEFQRNSVWPRPAKAYLIDTILNDRPIPIFFFGRATSPQTGRQSYTIIDGQQRLRAIFDYLADQFSLTESGKKERYYKKKFSALPTDLQEHIRNYDLVVEELSGYTDADIRDMFVRMNRYVVKLSPQELRHARAQGQFRDFVEKVASWDFWKANTVFSKHQLNRMKAVEFVAELTILLIEGPQDKKSAVDLYYRQYQKTLPFGSAVESKLRQYLKWVELALPNFSRTRYRKPVDLYALIGALDSESRGGKLLSKMSAQRAGEALVRLESQTRAKSPSGDAARYVVAASRQTDNVTPRRTRIEVISRAIHGE